MNFEQFCRQYNPVKNTFDSSSALNNHLFETDDEQQLEYIQSKNPNQVWSYDIRGGALKNGIYSGQDIIGYAICQKPFVDKRGKIKVEL